MTWMILLSDVTLDVMTGLKSCLKSDIKVNLTGWNDIKQSIHGGEKKKKIEIQDFSKNNPTRVDMLKKKSNMMEYTV